jgi:zinc protease
VLAEKWPGYFHLHASAPAEKWEAARDAVFDELELLKTEPASEEELHKSKRQLQKLIYSQLETVEGQASKLGYYELLGDYRLAAAHQEAIKQVTPAQVTAVADRYLRLENCSMVAYLPRDPNRQETSREHVEIQLKKRIAQSAGGDRSGGKIGAAYAKRPREGGTVSRTDSAKVEERVERIRLDNGVRVLVRNRPGIPLVTMLTMFQGGARLEGHGESGLSLLTLRSLVKGTRSYRAEDIAGAVEGYGGSLDSFSRFDTAGVYVNILSEHIEDVLPIYGEVVQEPLFEEGIVQKEKDKLLEEITVRKDTPFHFGMDRLFENVFGDHPYAHPFLGREEDVRSLSPARLTAWHRRMIVPGNIVICFVGDITVEKAAGIAETLYGRLAERPHPSPKTEPPVTSARPGLHESSRTSLKQAVALVGFTAPPMMSEDAVSLEVLNGILSGLGGRLFVELRDKRSLGYMTGSAFLPLKERSILFGYANPAADGVDEALKVIQREFDLVTKEPVTDEELSRAKAWLIGSLSIRHQKNYSKALAYSTYEILGYGYDVIERMPELINKVTKEDIQKAAAGVFDKDKAVLIKLIPE